MIMNNQKILVTGGAGFIGSSLVQHLLSLNNKVTVLDNFSAGNKLKSLKSLKSKNLKIIKCDCSSISCLQKLDTNFDTIFHLAADPEVRLSITNPKSIFKNNIKATFVLLEWVKNTSIKKIVFTSTSAVYGDAKKLPTPEFYPCNPISLYGGSKLACESLLSAYCETFKISGIVFRLANIVGPRSTHGILFDMINKLKKNSNKLEILGDGTQKKSYLYIDDCISGIMYAVKKHESLFNVFNLGSSTQITVKQIIDLLLHQRRIENIQKIYTGGVDGGRGWIGDVKKMQLDISKMKKIGWKSKFDSKNAIKKTLQNIESQQS